MKEEKMDGTRLSWLVELGLWSWGFLLLSIIIPAILIIILPKGLRGAGIATWALTPAIEYLAISVGIGLGLDPITSFLLTVLPCIGICMLIVALLGAAKDTSVRATKWLGKVQKRIQRYPRLKRYGVISNFVLIIFTGIYIGPGISIFLGWHRGKSMLLMAAGICSITLVLGLFTLGILDLFFK